VPVYIGQPVGSSLIASNRSFFNALTATGYFSWMQTSYGAPYVSGPTSNDYQFGVSGKPGTLVMTPGNTSSEGQIANELTAQIKAGNLPSSTGPTSYVYVVYVAKPYSTGLCGSSGEGGYNDSNGVANGLIFSVIPDYTDPSVGCGGNVTTTLSHEIAESINGYWAPSTSTTGQCTQIADLCEAGSVPTAQITVGSTSYTVQTLWSNIANACVIGSQGAPGDFNGDGYSDIVSTGSNNTSGVALGLSNGQAGSAMGFNYQNVGVNDGNFLSWWESQTWPLVGDFNGDGTADLALTGGSGWNSIPVGFSVSSNGAISSFNVVNDVPGCSSSSPGSGAQFPTYAAEAHLPPVVGDFDGDGLADIALAGNPGWATIPIAFSTQQGGFFCTNLASVNQPFAAILASSVNKLAGQSGGPQLLAGDFNGDGLSDLALVGAYDANGNALTTVPVALSNGIQQSIAHNFTNSDPTAQEWLSFTLQEWTVSNGSFQYWATQPGVVAVTGDFNGDGLTDIALSGGPSWDTIPIAFSSGGTSQSFNVQNNTDYLESGSETFSSFAQTKGAGLVAGDWGGFGMSALALPDVSTTIVPMATFFGDWFDYSSTDSSQFAAVAQTVSGATSWAYPLSKR
jgi:hypothetical protein